MIQAVMLYAIKSKKVELKFARFTSGSLIWPRIAATVSDSSTYGVLVCVNRNANGRLSADGREAQLSILIQSFPILHLACQVCGSCISDGQSIAYWTI